MAVTYGSYTVTKSITVPYPIGFDLTAMGDGSETIYVYLNPLVNCNVKVSGAAKMYTDVNGTLGECTTKAMTHVVFRGGTGTRVYIKLATGTAKLYITSKQIEEIGFYQGSGLTNCPKVGGSIADLITMRSFIVATRVNISSNINKLEDLVAFNLSTYINEGQMTGDWTNMINLTDFVVNDVPAIRLAGASEYYTGDLTNYIGHPRTEFSDEDKVSLFFTGDLTTIDPKFMHGAGWDALLGTVDAWTECYYIETLNSSVVINTVIGMKALGYIQIPNTVLTSVQVNQILADLLVNVDEAKTYVPTSDRTYDLSGAIGTGAPTGQGLLDKAALIAWTGGSGQKNNVTTR